MKSIAIRKENVNNSKYYYHQNNNKLKDTLSYFIEVIKDELPKISLTQQFDSIDKTFSFRNC